MKQNIVTTYDANGSPMPVHKVNDSVWAIRRIAEMEEIVERLTTQEKQRRSFAELLNGNFCVGESHSHILPKRFLIENMKTFKDSGFSVLFMEHLASDGDESERLQNLDEYHMDGKSLEYNFTNVVKKARECGIEVVYLEEDNACYKQYESGDKRMVSLNWNSRQVIKQQEQNFLATKGENLKWFAFVGSAHLYTTYNVPGICDIIPNVQDVLILDASESIPNTFFISSTPTEALKHCGNLGEDFLRLKASIMIVRNPKQSMRIADIESEASLQHSSESKEPESNEKKRMALTENQVVDKGFPYDKRQAMMTPPPRTRSRARAESATPTNTSHQI